MVASLIRLEHQVESLIHHIIPGEAGTAAQHIDSTQQMNVESGFAARYDETTHIHHIPKNTAHTNHSQHATESMWEKLRKLEARVEGLLHQLHGLKSHHSHINPEEKLENHQDGR